MKATDEIKKSFPNLNIEVEGNGFSISGTIEDVEFADRLMDTYIPTEYRRGILFVSYEMGTSTRTYRRNGLTETKNRSLL